MGLLLRLLNSYGVCKDVRRLLLLLQFLTSAFLFRARSTLSLVSLRTKHWNWWVIQGLYFPVQDSVYSHCCSEDQVCHGTFLFETWSTLSLCLRTKYQISHTVGRLFPVAAFLPAPRNRSRLSHWGYSWAVQALLTSSAQKYYCHKHAI